MAQIAFAVLALVTLIGAVGVVASRSVFVSALWLVLSFFGVAGMYVLLDAGFLAVIQVLIYVGAISVLILFAVMLTPNLMEQGSQLNKQASISIIVALVLFGALMILGFGTQWPVQLARVLPAGGGQVTVAAAVGAPDVETVNITKLPYTHKTTTPAGEVVTVPGPTAMLGMAFMSDQLLAFEVISIILLVALMGAIVIARE